MVINKQGKSFKYIKLLPCLFFRNTNNNYLIITPLQ